MSSAGSSWRARRSPRTTRWSRSRRTRRRWASLRRPRGSSRASTYEKEVVPVGTVLVAIGGDAEPAPSEPDVSRGQTPAVSQPAGTRARATPLVRKIASGLESTWRAWPGPARRGGSPKRTCAPLQVTQDPTRKAGAAPRSSPRDRGAHGARTPGGAACDLVEECDFGAVDLDRLVATVVKACADELRAFPSSTLASSATRSSTSTATTSASPCRPRRG